MPDQIPRETRGSLFGHHGVVVSVPIGQRCILTWFPVGDTEWLRFGAPTLRGGLDASQGQVYYRRASQTKDAEVRVVLPSDLPFRSSRKGLVESRTISFDPRGFPVPELLALYAIKTRQLQDRFTAIEELIDRELANSNYRLIGRLKESIDSEEDFVSLAGYLMSDSARMPGGLKRWRIWEELADKAMERGKARIKKDAEIAKDRHHAEFIQAVKESTLEFGGLPYENDVRKRWQCNHENQSDPTAVAKTLGLSWIPSHRMWKANWRKGSNGRFYHPAELR